MPSAPPAEEAQPVRGMQRLALAASPDAGTAAPQPQWTSRPAGAHSPAHAGSGADAVPSRISVSLFGASLSCGSSAAGPASPLPASGTSPSGIARAFSVQQAQQQLAQQHAQAGAAAAPQQPATTHTISHNDTSVLSLAVDEASGLVFSGSQCEDIFVSTAASRRRSLCMLTPCRTRQVWDLNTYQERTRLIGHTASVLALELCAEKGWLFSASGECRRQRL
jgi:WD40 repeat protein